MSVCSSSDNVAIPEEIGTWGESYLEPDNLYRVVGNQLYSSMSWDELKSMYSNMGRPPINPIILSLVTIFQYLEDIPDRVAASFVKTRLDWKYALHLPLDDSGFHYSDLCNFRKRLLSHGKESLIFDELLESIRTLGFLKKRKYQRSDSTHVLAKVCHLSRLENLSEGLRLALRAIEKADAVFYQVKLPAPYREQWDTRLNDYRMTDEERKQALERAGQDIRWLLEFLKTNRASFLSLPELEVLQTLFQQNFTIHAQAVQQLLLRKQCANGKEKIQTPHDPEAHYSTKRGKSWTGYKMHVTETANDKGEVNFITDVVTTNACDRDNETLPQIQENIEKRNLNPDQQFTDKAYITGNNLANSQDHGIKLMGEASQLANNGLFTADDFIIDHETKTATCPAGCTSCSWRKFETGKHKGDIQISFGQQCQHCSQKERCTKNKRGRLLRLHSHYQLLKERREEGKTDSFKEAMKRRPPVEGTISEMVRAHGLRRSRYRGILKTHLQNLVTGAALNLKRLVKAIGLSKSSEKHQSAAV
jgi:transposase